MQRTASEDKSPHAGVHGQPRYEGVGSGLHPRYGTIIISAVVPLENLTPGVSEEWDCAGE